MSALQISRGGWRSKRQEKVTDSLCAVTLLKDSVVKGRRAARSECRSLCLKPPNSMICKFYPSAFGRTEMEQLANGKAQVNRQKEGVQQR